MRALTCRFSNVFSAFTETDTYRRVNEESILAIQIFDQKKFKKKDQGFLGVINVRIGAVIDLEIGGDGKFTQVVTGCSTDFLDKRCSLETLKSRTTTSSCMASSL